MLKTTALIVALSATAAMADLAVQFDEGAPKDRFTVTNTGGCALPALAVTLDLGKAPAGLIFDVTGSGAGVEVFQPFELVSGAQVLRDTPAVLDGDAAVTLNLTGLAVNQSVAFTIDVDDTGGGREITVNGSEIAGAQVTATVAGRTSVGSFDTAAQALIGLDACAS